MKFSVMFIVLFCTSLSPAASTSWRKLGRSLSSGDGSVYNNNNEQWNQTVIFTPLDDELDLHWQNAELRYHEIQSNVKDHSVSYDKVLLHHLWYYVS